MNERASLDCVRFRSSAAGRASGGTQRSKLETTWSSSQGHAEAVIASVSSSTLRRSQDWVDIEIASV